MNITKHLNTNNPHPRFTLKRIAFAVALSVASMAQGAPVGGVVVGGGANISSAGSNTTIVQSTPKAIINWQGFSIAPTESVRFIQPSSSAIILNRVMGPEASSILGNLSANGRVFLINPNGILFGKGSQVNVGGMVASTLGISDANFIAGNYQFSGNSQATLINQGTLGTNADAGYIALLGANVSNNGLISARLGTVALAAGNAITLDLAGDNLLKVSIDQGAMNALVSNGHLIIADGGQVLMTAKGAGTLLSNTVNNTGVIQAQSIESHNGSIILSSGSESGITNVSGLLDASGLGTGQTGGSVQVLGSTVNLVNANINASGNAGGGLVLVGGNFKGSGPQANSLNTNMDSASIINASAIETGDGGKIALWSDGTTVVGGTLLAQGGRQSGNGGYVETSGPLLSIGSYASVNTLAPKGVTGMWLVDPTNYEICAICSGTTGESAASVVAKLVLSNYTIDATNDITVSEAVSFGTAARTLTLHALNGNILVNATMDASGLGSGFTFLAGNNITTNSTITTTGNNSIIALTAGNDVLINAAMTASNSGSQINALATRDVIATDTLTASQSGASINLTGHRDVTATTVTTAGGGSLNLLADRNVSVGTATATGTANIEGGLGGTGPGVAGGTATIGTVTAATTKIRFNPVTYATTSTEITQYAGKITGATDIKAWVFTQANDKAYDQSRTATVSLQDSPVGAALVLGTANFDTKNVGNAKAVAYSGYSLADPTANYALFSGSGATTANITPATLTVTAVGTNKIYNANTTDAVTLTSNAYSGDVVVLSDSAANFSTKNVGNGIAVAVTGITVTGADAGNYTANTSTTTSANITKAPLTVAATGTNKVYDGTTADVVTLNSNAYSGDTVALSYGAANFANSSIGTNKPVSVTGITTSGLDASNYTANTTTSTTASITPGIPTGSGGSYSGSGSPYIVPVVPLGLSNQPPAALQADMRSGVSTPEIVPVVASGMALGAGAGYASNSNPGLIGAAPLGGLLASNQPSILAVTPQRFEPQMQSLFPAPIVVPVLIPKQGRN